MMTKNNRSDGSVGVRFGNYISVDPRKKASGFKGGDNICKEIWNECIDSNLIPKKEFINRFYTFIEIYGLDNLDIYNPFLSKYNFSLKNKSNNKIDKVSNLGHVYKFKDDYKQVNQITKRYKWDPIIAKKVIILSQFKCNVDSQHITFIDKNNKQYMETHHLIPMKAQDKFKNSLDVDANIVCLCPNCHRKLHFGKNVDYELKKLYEDRAELLNQSGIYVSFDDLKKFYE